MSGFKIDPVTNCFNWTGSTVSGYGRVWYKCKMHRVHKLVYESHHGKLDQSLEVRHLCHNTRCANPDHLASGTRTYNMQDSARDGRTCRGERRPSSVLTEKQVREIKVSALSCRKAAKLYDVSPETISKIRRGVGWKYVEH